MVIKSMASSVRNIWIRKLTLTLTDLMTLKLDLISRGFSFLTFWAINDMTHGKCLSTDDGPERVQLIEANIIRKERNWWLNQAKSLALLGSFVIEVPWQSWEASISVLVILQIRQLRFRLRLNYLCSWL